MTTSEPQADPRGDDGREHRTIGQRIRDAVLGEPADDVREEGPTARTADPDQGNRGYSDPDRRTGERGTEYVDPAQGERHYADRGTEYADPAAPGAVGDPGLGRDPAYPDATDPRAADPATGRDTGEGGGMDRPAGTPAPTSAVDAFGAESAGTDRAAGYADAPRSDADRGSSVDEGRRGSGGAAPVGEAGAHDTDREYAPYEQAMQEHVQGGAVPDPVRDDVTQDGTSRTGRADDMRAGAGAGAAGVGDDRDLVTSSYDPDRDRGHDPQAAGTAMADPSGGPVDRDRRDRDTRGYDPTADAGYVDERRADVDASTGGRDADYDTGRVDTDTTHRGGGTAAAVAAGGAAAAAGVAAAHHRSDRGAGFSEVDDTSTVDATSTGRATTDPAPVGSTAATGDAVGDSAAGRAEAVADETEGSQATGGRERLVPADRAQDYSTRWDALKGDFVDEPRRAVAQADGLVGELLDEIQRLFADQRRDLEQGFDHDRASTEDLRLALRRYRSFFDRLLSF